MAVQQQLTAWQSIRPFLRKFKRLLEGAVQPLFQARGYPAHGFGYYWRKQQDLADLPDTLTVIMRRLETFLEPVEKKF